MNPPESLTGSSSEGAELEVFIAPEFESLPPSPEELDVDVSDESDVGVPEEDDVDVPAELDVDTLEEPDVDEPDSVEEDLSSSS